MVQQLPLPSGWDRQHWAEFADNLLLAVRPYASEGHARITLPGAEGGYGHAVDGLEGFARTFLAAGFRLKGENGNDPHGFAQWYAKGLDNGTNPDAPDRWVTMAEHPQAKVEAASIALILDMTRPWIWDKLEPRVQQQIIHYLSAAIGDNTYPPTNWCWFRLVVETFLRSVGGPYSLDDMRADLALHDTFQRENGWMADGPERSFDYYNGWALHLYPILWAQMKGAEDLVAERGDRDKKLLARFLEDAVTLVGADGAPLIEGRSLTYRFAAAAPFWVGVIAGVDSVPMGQLKRAAAGVVNYFVTHGAPDERGILPIGWWNEWRQIAQSYSGPSSPYWATKGLLGLSLPADHPIWGIPEEPLPIETGDFLRVIEAPGWIVSGTKDDGIVRVINHGSDHALAGDDVGDSPLYSRLGYSTATSPWLDNDSWRHPAEETAGFVDAQGNVTHRGGWEALGVRIDNPGSSQAVAVGSSRVNARWIDMPENQVLHGSGWTGKSTQAGTLTVVSVVRGNTEVRIVRIDQVAAGLPEGTKLRISGWPTVAGDGLTSSVVPLLPITGSTTGSVERADASPLGPGSSAPYTDFPVTPGGYAVAAVKLTGTAEEVAAGPLTCNIDETGSAHITWPDGVTTVTALATN